MSKKNNDKPLAERSPDSDEAAVELSTVVAALYKFVELPDFEALRDPLLAACESAGIKGTLLLAEEGINGTIAGSRETCRVRNKSNACLRNSCIE